MLGARIMENGSVVKTIETEIPRATIETKIPRTSGFAVWRWPEFQAFIDRLGVPLNLRTRKITIMLDEGNAIVIQEYLAGDRQKSWGGKDQEDAAD
jgi:hypothetical protein